MTAWNENIADSRHTQPRSVRRRVLWSVGLLVLSLLAVGGLAFASPLASAAGGCGGG
jgi:hypothetical protein